MSPASPSLPLANSRTRLLAGLVTFVLTALVLLVGVGVGLISRDSTTWSDTLTAMLVPVLVAGGIWALMVMGLLAGTGATPGQWVLGVGAVNQTTGEPAGSQALRKEATLVLLGVATLGIAPLVMLRDRDPRTGANRFDRLAGTLVVQHRGHGVPVEGAGFLAAMLHTPAHRTPAPGTQTPDAQTHPTRAPEAQTRSPRTQGSATAEPEPESTPVGGLALLDQGTRLPLDRTWVLGRNPTPPASHPSAQPFLVPDVDKTLSKSHLVLAPVGGGVSVTDLYSTNGVSVTLPDGTSRTVGGGRTVTVPFGTTVTWGARSLQVLR